MIKLEFKKSEFLSVKYLAYLGKIDFLNQQPIQ